jgi:hypothetical protein
VVERTLGQRPEIPVVAGGRQHPGVFELLRAPDFREAVRVRSGRRAVARDCGVDVEQRAVGIKREGAYRHGASLQLPPMLAEQADDVSHQGFSWASRGKNP